VFQGSALSFGASFSSGRGKNSEEFERFFLVGSPGGQNYFWSDPLIQYRKYLVE